MKKIVFLALILLILPLVLGVSTPIAIKAPADLNITINIIKTQDDLVLRTYQVLTNSINEANIIHESDFSGSIYLTVIARQAGRIYPYNETNPLYTSQDFYSGNSITVDYIGTPEPEPIPTIIQEPENITEEPTTQEIAASDVATGSSILETIPFKKIGTYAGWTIGAIIILGLLAFLVLKVAIPYINNPLRKAEFSGYGSVNLNDKTVEKDLRKAEAKLKEAQVEIDRIKNQRNEVKEAEAKFLVAKKELERVKGKI